MPRRRRALAYALINGELTGLRLWRMGLTTLVPYRVSTLSRVGAMRRHIRSGGSGLKPNGGENNLRDLCPGPLNNFG